MRSKKKRCGSLNTTTGRPCRYLAHSCPWRFSKHRPTSSVATEQASTSLLDDAIVSNRQLSALPTTEVDTSVLVANYMSDADYGIHTNPVDFAEALTKARNKYPIGINDHDIIRDMYMVTALWSLSEKYPGGVITVKNQRYPKGGDEYITRGRIIFVGGTALSAAHKITQRYSEDIDFLYVPTRLGNTRKNIIQRSHDVVSASAKGVSSIRPSYRRSFGLVIQGNISLPQHEDFITVDVVNRKEFQDNAQFVKRLDLLEIEQKPLISMVGRAAPEYLNKYPQLGGFSLPVVGEPYIAVTKLDALSRRGENPKLHHQITYRWRDLYDLHCLAQNDKAAHISERLPEVAFFSENDSLRKNNFKRPKGGYGTSQVFQLGTPANDALRAGVETRMRTLVWERPLPTFEEMIDSARSLDSHA